MKLKKVLFFALASFFLFGFSNNASAEEAPVVDEEVVESIAEPVNNAINNSIQSSYKVRSSIKVYDPLFLTNYAVAKSTTTRNIDYLYARSRTFNGDGGLIKSKSSSAKNSSYASAKAKNGTIYSKDDWAIGNHTYKDSGYKTIKHETRAEW
ncbi:XoxI protein [Virgibacillus sp. M23]|uniref:XoxI protein n=1 Tax=Virgibacillus sp. M23 TaxID=3079030 RepID=UPI002A914995|nr:XoxI protein [Virgibacillus sp. M23]MDY7043707.1 XoxI protein [Virgibacillus sp. M23]